MIEIFSGAQSMRGELPSLRGAFYRGWIAGPNFGEKRRGLGNDPTAEAVAHRDHAVSDCKDS